MELIAEYGFPHGTPKDFVQPGAIADKDGFWWSAVYADGAQRVYRWKYGMATAEAVGGAYSPARGSLGVGKDGNLYLHVYAPVDGKLKMRVFRISGFAGVPQTQTPQHCLSAVAELERRIASLEIRLHELVELLRQAR